MEVEVFQRHIGVVGHREVIAHRVPGQELLVAGLGDSDLQIGRLVIGRDFDDLPRILQCDIVDGWIKLEIGRRGDFPDFIARQR